MLVVDDSLTVRELERKLLSGHGYEVEIAVDGMDGWNAVRTGHFDLVVTDIDMPRMDGIELVGLINKDPNLKRGARDGRLVQGPRGRSPARPRGRRGALSDQGELPRRDAAAGGRRSHRRGRRMRIGIVSGAARETKILQRAVALKPEHRLHLECADRRRSRGALRDGNAGPRPDGSGRAGNGRCRGHAANHGVRPMRGFDRHRQRARAMSARVFEAMGHGALDVVEMPCRPQALRAKARRPARASSP